MPLYYDDIKMGSVYYDNATPTAIYYNSVKVWPSETTIKVDGSFSDWSGSCYIGNYVVSTITMSYYDHNTQINPNAVTFTQSVQTYWTSSSYPVLITITKGTDGYVNFTETKQGSFANPGLSYSIYYIKT